MPDFHYIIEKESRFSEKRLKSPIFKFYQVCLNFPEISSEKTYFRIISQNHGILYKVRRNTFTRILRKMGEILCNFQNGVRIYSILIYIL